MLKTSSFIASFHKMVIIKKYHVSVCEWFKQMCTIHFYIPLTRRSTRGNIKVLFAIRNAKGTFCPVLERDRKRNKRVIIQLKLSTIFFKKERDDEKSEIDGKTSFETFEHRSKLQAPSSRVRLR